MPHPTLLGRFFALFFNNSPETINFSNSQSHTAGEELAGLRNGGSLGRGVTAGYGETIQADYGLSAVVDAGSKAQRAKRRIKH